MSQLATLTGLHVYPLKGARGIALEHAEVLPQGIRHDRRFMLVGEDGVFLSQRVHPRLALVEVAIGAAELAIAASGSHANVPLAPEGPRRRVRVWDDDVDAIVVDGEASGLLSEHLGLRCSLVFMPDDIVRAVDPTYARPGDRVGFADGFPLLVAAQASLDDLNARLETPVPMNRFRPNLVIAGTEAWEEERHAGARIGELVVRMPKRCARCTVTLVDQATGERGKEPLRTLATFRAENAEVYFAQNAIPDQAGVVRVGDSVELLTRIA
jgi:hypothetical protein